MTKFKKGDKVKILRTAESHALPNLKNKIGTVLSSYRQVGIQHRAYCILDIASGGIYCEDLELIPHDWDE